MSYTNSWSYTSPTATATVTIWGDRNGASLTIHGRIVCAFQYSNDYLAYNGSINWNIWTGDTISGTEVKGYSDRWYASNEMSRTREVSFTITDISSQISMGFGCSVPSGYSCFYVPDTIITLDVPSYNAPNAPTWLNVTPNPAHVYSPNSSQSMLVTWGGASAGTLGTLYYDVEIRARNSSGNWTNWLRRSNAQSGTSWTELPINSLNINGTEHAPGVDYQYRVESSDGSYLVSQWVYSDVITTSYTAPTAPTNYTVNPSPAKVKDNITVSWSGASGGAGNISWYEIGLEKYDKSTSTWTGRVNPKTQSQTSWTFSPLSYYSDLTNGDMIRFYVTTRNSYGIKASSYVTITIKSNVIYIKVNGSWQEGTPYIKINGSWQEGTPYIKVNSSWQEGS